MALTRTRTLLLSLSGKTLWYIPSAFLYCFLSLLGVLASLVSHLLSMVMGGMLSVDQTRSQCDRGLCGR